MPPDGSESGAPRRKRKNPQAYYTVGFQYQVFVLLADSPHASWTNALVGMIYK
ncbi:MAG: hypothetical protein R2912_00675 [Eubacteriales bacterium]